MKTNENHIVKQRDSSFVGNKSKCDFSGFWTAVNIILVLLLMTRIFVIPVSVSGSSMEPTYHDGDALYGERTFLTKVDPIERGDIIVFDSHDETEPHYIKRVIGLPGETIQIGPAGILVNDTILEDEYVKPDYYGIAENPVKLGKDEYFVLGDNRPVSKDSRYFGAVKKEDISCIILHQKK